MMHITKKNKSFLNSDYYIVVVACSDLIMIYQGQSDDVIFDMGTYHPAI